MIIQNGDTTIEIGGNAPALVIPEVGINHNGSLQVAKEMVDAACKNNSDLARYISQVLVPTEKVYATRGGKKVLKERILLPG